METHISSQRAEDGSSSFGFENVYHLDAIGFRGGIWVLWNERDTNLKILSVTNQAIYAFMQVSALNPFFNWLFTMIYASPDLQSHLNLWDDLTTFANSHSFPWVLVGDFNETLACHECLSSSLPNCRRMSIFNEFIIINNFLDLGFSGPRFTWTNKRDNGLVMKCLNRVF